MTTSNWQTSLLALGATVENGEVIHYADASNALIATSNRDTLCDLSHLGLIEVSGVDAVGFLQGQVSNDVNLLNGNNAHYSAYCNPKGRMLALFLAFAHFDHLHLQLPRELLAPIIKRLKMYVMRSKVDIVDVSDTIIKFGINGPNAANLLASLFAQVPTDHYQLISLENGTLLKLPTVAGHTRFQIFTTESNAPMLLNALKNKCQLVGKPCWDWLDIQAGIPEVLLATQEQFVPQMLNLDILNGINFKKGCYTGQEIIARTHYLGSVKRRTYLATIETNTAPLAGDKVLDSANNAVGQIVRVAPNTLNSFDALIELRIEAKEAGNITYKDVAVTFKDLPYKI